MNIAVKTYGGRVIVRPDTTWERKGEDFFAPDYVEELSYSPVLYARISKPGRSVSRKFASRYYDGIGYGILLFPENLIDGSDEGYSAASCIDHSSYLPVTLYNPVTLGVEGNEFRIERDGEEIFRREADSRAMVDEAVEIISSRTFLRSGDLIAIELQPRLPLSSRKNGKIAVKAEFCENTTIEFSVIY